MSKQKVFLPPKVATPRGPFQKCYVDTMHLPLSGGFKFVVQARDSLFGWPEFAMLRKEKRKTLGWGVLMEIVTDNGTPFVAALEWLSGKYNVSQIRISSSRHHSCVVESKRRTLLRRLLLLLAVVRF
jgi:hypothetical protein